jgi:L-threonylcarbamoyladenylate synthase
MPPRRLLRSLRLGAQAAAAFWPGADAGHAARPPSVSLLASAGLDSLAVRPDIGRPGAVARAGPPPHPVTARASKPDHGAACGRQPDGQVELILDGGACPRGHQSTVVDVSGPSPVLLRRGGVTQEDIEAVISKLAAANSHRRQVARQLKPLRTRPACA